MAVDLAGWDLPSYLAVTVQIGTILPLIYTIAIKLLGRQLPQQWAIAVLMTFACLCNVLMMAMWKDTALIFGLGMLSFRVRLHDTIVMLTHSMARLRAND